METVSLNGPMNRTFAVLTARRRRIACRTCSINFGFEQLKHSDVRFPLHRDRTEKA